MKAWITGGGFVTAKGFGTLSELKQPQLAQGEPQIPRGREIFQIPLGRYGRFDRYTKLGCAGIALAVRDAKLDKSQGKRAVGIVLSTEYECYASDLDYYQTTLDESGAYTSPNLFSYTLPGIVLGEMAIHFKTTGPTVIIGEADGKGLGWTALDIAMDLLVSGQCDTIIAGWLDSPPREIAKKDSTHGSVFIALTTQQTQSGNSIYKQNKVLKNSIGQEITSVLDLF